MSKINIIESANVALGIPGDSKRWKVRIIGLGRGSKAVYTQESMATVAAAFPIGTKVNADHRTWTEKDERPEGSIKDIIGIIVSEPIVESDGAYAEVEFTDEWAPKIAQIHSFVGMSIHAQVEWSEQSEDGLPIVSAFIPHPLNTVDVVTVAGAKGKIIEVMESIGYDIIDDKSTEKIEGNIMGPEELEELIVKVVDRISARNEVKDDDKAVNMAEATEAIIASGLPKVAREQVFLAVESGVSIDDAIKSQKNYVDALAKVMDISESGAKRKMSDENSKEMNFELGAWN